MARQRTQIAAEKLTGQLEKRPQRYRDRSDPTTNDHGSPPDYLSPAAVVAQMDHVDEIPWLGGGDNWVEGLVARLFALTRAPRCPMR